MRQQRPTTLILAVSLALFANAALAQRATTGGVRPAGTVGAAPTASAPAASASTSGNVNAGNSVNANSQGSSATIVTTTSGNQVTMGVPANGTQGSNTANGTNPTPDIVQGQTSGTSNGSTAGTSNGSTTGTSNGSTSPGVVPSGVANLQSRLIDANGNILVDANGNALLSDGRNIVGVAPVATGFEGAVMGVDPNQVVVTGAALSPSSTVTSATPELDRATRKELVKARTASRTNRQLLTSIVPRTNVDRTDQMADDPIPLRY